MPASCARVHARAHVTNLSGHLLRSGSSPYFCH
jgi:hypothetical protein